MSAVLEATPTKQKYTPEDLFLLPDRGKGFELINGELRELNVSFLATYIAGQIYFHLRAFVAPRGLGWVLPEGTSYRCFPDDPGRVRRADTAFHALERLTAAQAVAEGHCTVVPDVVVEVVSPNDLASDVNQKRAEWLAAGARLVWVVDPVLQTIHAYRSDGTVSLFNAGDTLRAEPVLAEFQVPVAELFRLPAASP